MIPVLKMLLPLESPIPIAPPAIVNEVVEVKRVVRGSRRRGARMRWSARLRVGRDVVRKWD